MANPPQFGSASAEILLGPACLTRRISHRLTCTQLLTNRRNKNCCVTPAAVRGGDSGVIREEACKQGAWRFRGELCICLKRSYSLLYLNTDALQGAAPAPPPPTPCCQSFDLEDYEVLSPKTKAVAQSEHRGPSTSSNFRRDAETSSCLNSGRIHCTHGCVCS